MEISMIEMMTYRYSIIVNFDAANKLHTGIDTFLPNTYHIITCIYSQSFLKNDASSKNHRRS
jgi:hypothetical protein